MGEVRAWVPAAELRPGDLIVWAQRPEGTAVVTKVERHDARRIMVTFDDATTTFLFPDSDCSVLNRRLEQPQQIKAAAELKEGDRVRWHDGETRVVHVSGNDRLGRVCVETGTDIFYVPPFMAVVVEGTDG